MLEYYTCRKGFFSLVRILIYAFVPCDPWFGSNGSLKRKVKCTWILDWTR